MGPVRKEDALTDTFARGQVINWSRGEHHYTGQLTHVSEEFLLGRYLTHTVKSAAAIPWRLEVPVSSEGFVIFATEVEALKVWISTPHQNG